MSSAAFAAPPMSSAHGLPLVGVLGGMGPLATVDFLGKLVAATPARCDQEHLPVMATSIPQIPDRTAAYRGHGRSPLPAMVDSGRRLVDAGASVVVMPCNTAHLWFEPLREALGLPMLHLVDAAVTQALAACGGVPAGAADAAPPIGLLATEATLDSGLYTDRAPQVRWVLPSAADRAARLSPGIAAVKGGDLARGRALLGEAARALADAGARVLVLGCTEIPLVVGAGDAPVPVIDATAALARRTVAWALARRVA